MARKSKKNKKDKSGFDRSKFRDEISRPATPNKAM